MNILFIHQNFPGQFKFLAPALSAKGNNVFALTMQEDGPASFEGVRVLSYRPTRGTSEDAHPWLKDFEAKVIRGESCFRVALKLKSSGFFPEVVVAHPGWGESLFVKEVWPSAKLVIYCEYFYRLYGADIGFDPEYGDMSIEESCQLKLKNISQLLQMEMVDAAMSPTVWQASTYPSWFQGKITVIHDGIDTQVAAPNACVKLKVNGSLLLTRSDEILTFVNRNLEPYRGYHIFMRALPSILKNRPKLTVLIVGGDGVSYGRASQNGDSWRDIFANEARTAMSEEEWSRVHFLGRIPYKQMIAVLQLSSVHVYLTYPFVLSWSLLEAMSCGCAVVASDTAPVREVIKDGTSGRLFNFFDVSQLAQIVVELLGDLNTRQRLGQLARQVIQEDYDLRSRCLPKQLKWIENVNDCNPEAD